MSIYDFYEEENYFNNKETNQYLDFFNDDILINNSNINRIQTNINVESNISSNKICGIYNTGNHYYLISGFQILVSCTELIQELYKTNKIKGIVLYLKEAIYYLINKDYYDPTKFINFFNYLNPDFIKDGKCTSQDFIRTLIININSEYMKAFTYINENNTQYNPRGKDKIEFEKFMESYNINQESKIQSLFYGILKSQSFAKCAYCNNNVEKIAFNSFIDFNIKLDNINKNCKFSEVLANNLDISRNITKECPHCHNEIVLKTENKFIKLPDILIFTLERTQEGPNILEIFPDETLNIANYVDEYLDENFTTYELFAVNIRIGNFNNFVQEKCQIKRKEIWYEIDGSKAIEINKPSYFEFSYGLFYRKKFDFTFGRI